MAVKKTVKKKTSSKPSGVALQPVARASNPQVQFRRRRGPLAGVWSFIVWLVGVLVSLAVGFGMADGVLNVRYIPPVVTAVAGWIVVVLTVVGVVLKIIDSLS
jgi:hypothetical protein